MEGRATNRKKEWKGVVIGSGLSEKERKSSRKTAKEKKLKEKFIHYLRETKNGRKEEKVG